MRRHDRTPKGGEQKSPVRLVALPPVAAQSKYLIRLPLYRDPLAQVGVLVVILSAALVGIVAAPPGLTSQALIVTALATTFLGLVVLLRSVRHGWNILAWRRARQALRHESAMRTERDSLRRLLDALAAMAMHEATAPTPDKVLEPLVLDAQHAVSQHCSGTSVVIAEQANGRFRVVCAAGEVRRPPHFVSPGKSCKADRSFEDLLASFSPAGTTLAQQVVIAGRTHWIGVIIDGADAQIDEAIVRMLASCLALVVSLSSELEHKPSILAAG